MNDNNPEPTLRELFGALKQDGWVFVAGITVFTAACLGAALWLEAVQ